MISSSKLELIEVCPGSLTLPWRDSPNEHSDAGSERHEGDELAINAGDVPEEYESRWPGLTWRAEVSYVYDVASGSSRFVGVGIKRAYGERSAFDIPGTIDAEGRGPGILVVVDRKGYEQQAPASRHRQVRFLALAAARAEPADRIVVAIRPEIGPMDIDEIDPVFDLDVIAHDTKQLLIDAARVRSDAREGRPVAFNVGRQCRWCPAFDECPKQQELRALVVRDDSPLNQIAIMSDDDATDLYELYKRVGILYKRMGEQLYRHAAARPIRTRNGRVFGPHEKLGDREYDGPTVHAVVAANPDLGRDVADKVVEMVASQAQFERVVKPLVAKGKFTATKKSVFSEVERLGKMIRKKTTSIEEYEPGPRLVTDGDDATDEPQIAEAPF